MMWGRRASVFERVARGEGPLRILGMEIRQDLNIWLYFLNFSVAEI